MGVCGVIAFLNLGLPETIVIAVVALVLFGPKAGRTMGNLARTILGAKKEMDDARHGLTRQIERQVGDALGKSEKRDEPKAPPRDDSHDE